MTSILRLPLRVAGRAADLALMPLRLAGSVAERVTGRGGTHAGEPGPPPPAAETRAPAPAPQRTPPAPTRPPATDPPPPAAPAAPAEIFTDGPAAGAAFAPIPSEPATPFAPPPPEPSIAAVGEDRLRQREEGRTEDSPGAVVHVDEPWDGYKEMAAPDIVDRLLVADGATRAVVLLYEQTHKRRTTVLEAAFREP